MQFSLKPDYEQSCQRYEAFWHQEIIDRPPVSITLAKENPKILTPKTYRNHEERWLDIEYRAEMIDTALRNRIYYADALPIAFPNMGPEIFSAWCGCGYQYGQDTTWSVPCIEDWEQDEKKAAFNPQHPLYRKTMDFTKLLLEYGVGSFIVGLTDFHPGADHIAALRDPQNMAIDLLENPEPVKRLLQRSYQDYFQIYDAFYALLSSSGMPITSWLPLIHTGKYYIPSNDFSCMISTPMFIEFFLPWLIEECKFYDRSIYHLDGPGALRHLDTILDVEDLDALQWVCGAGNEGFHRWVSVYQKVQKKGKSMQLNITLAELPLVFETLRPEGVWFADIQGVNDLDTAEKVIKRIEKWA